MFNNKKFKIDENILKEESISNDTLERPKKIKEEIEELNDKLKNLKIKRENHVGTGHSDINSLDRQIRSVNEEIREKRQELINVNQEIKEKLRKEE